MVSFPELSSVAKIRCVAFLQSFGTYYVAASQNAAGATGRLSGGNMAVYTEALPKIAPFSARGPNIYFGTDNPSPTAQPVADVLKPNIVGPGVDIWSAWSPLSTMEKPLNFRGTCSHVVMLWIISLLEAC